MEHLCIGFVGTEAEVALWKRVVATVPGWEAGPRLPLETPDRELITALLDVVDAVAVAGSPGVRGAVIQEALKMHKGVFTRWPPALSQQEWRRLAVLAEESGVEPVIEQPLRFHPLLPEAPVRLVVHEWHHPDVGEEPFPWNRVLAMAGDLYLYLTRGSYPRILDVEVLRTGTAIPRALMVYIRFQNGACVQALLLRGATRPLHRVQLGDAGGLRELYLNEGEGCSYEQGVVVPSWLRARAFRRFLETRAEGVQDIRCCTDGRPLMRILEHIQSRIRW